MADVAARKGSAGESVERTPHGLPRLGVVGMTVGLVGAVVIFLSALFGSSPRPTTHRTLEVTADPGDQMGKPQTHVNELGGYAFEVPAGWVVRDRGSASELISPDAGVVVSFGTGRPGGLSEALEALVDSIRIEYSDVRMSALERTHVDGQPAVVAAGSLRNSGGVRVRFLGLAMGLPTEHPVIAAMRVVGESRVIAVFVSQPADPAEVLPVVERVIGSFEAA